MRPPRDDIAAPPWPPDAAWSGSDPLEMERLTARGPVLVHFFDFGQLNSVRTLPYLEAWRERYEQAGLSVIGVHTPRYPFSEDRDAVASAVDRLGIAHPVVADERRTIWADYGCHGWPSLFLWSKGGALRWYHAGEGEYRATEEAIQVELEGTEPLEPLEPLRPQDAPGARVATPSAELLPGGSERQPWRASSEQPGIEIEFAAAGAWATLDGEGTVEVSENGERRRFTVERAGLYELAAEGPHREGLLELRPEPGVLVYSVSFAAGIPMP